MDKNLRKELTGLLALTEERLEDMAERYGVDLNRIMIIYHQSGLNVAIDRAVDKVFTEILKGTRI